jgi:hypothetical protein
MEGCEICYEDKPNVIVQYECDHSMCYKCHIHIYHSKNVRLCSFCRSIISIKTIIGEQCVILSSLSKKNTKIPWSDDMTIGDLTYLLIDMERSMYTIDEIKLVFSGKSIRDRNKLLKDCGITSGDKIYHILSLRGD